MLPRTRTALTSLPSAVVWIDDADEMLELCRTHSGLLESLFRPFFERQNLRLILTVNDQALAECEEDLPELRRYFETLPLLEPTLDHCEEIIRGRAAQYEQTYGIRMHSESPQAIVRLAMQLPSPRALPDRAFRLLNEACAECRMSGRPILTAEEIHTVVADRVGGPSRRLARPEMTVLQKLPDTLRERVRGQTHATTLVADIIRRGWLGLRNPSRPIGSFLFLGPSGVGKTECAKALSDLVYGNSHAFVRLDMSEFAEEHTRQRLIGAPPGYVGHEAGGQLTNPIAERPFSLILLDEMEKAHSSLWDLFLQVLDDGRLTDGKGHTVDFTKTILIATSNLCTQRILEATMQGEDVTSEQFLSTHLMPFLLRQFRAEFLNRFDAIVVFRPLTTETLLEIARMELQKIEARVASHQIRFSVSDAQLQETVRRFADPRFGARPLKRFLEQTCERLVSAQLLSSGVPLKP